MTPKQKLKFAEELAAHAKALKKEAMAELATKQKPAHKVGRGVARERKAAKAHIVTATISTTALPKLAKKPAKKVRKIARKAPATMKRAPGRLANGHDRHAPF